MGAWDATSFGNDHACDWAYELEKQDDLSLIESTLRRVSEIGEEYIEVPDGEEATAAAEVVAWLKGNPSELNAYTESLAGWVAAHPLAPSPALIALARSVLQRLQTEPSELLEVWDGDPDWIAAMADLDSRLS
jgi:hypothetical protein